MSDTKTQVAVGQFEGKVVLKFDHSLIMLELDPNNALDIAEEIAKVGIELNTGVKPGNGLKIDLAEKAAKTLIPRITLMLRGMKGKPDAYKANQIVATCLSEVL